MPYSTAKQAYTPLEPLERLRAVEPLRSTDASMADSDDPMAPAHGILLAAAIGSVFWVSLGLAGYAAWAWLSS